MDISLIYELTTPDATSDPEMTRRRYDECIEQVELVDRLGYRGVWFTEHHFLPGFSQSPAPEIFLAVLSQRTKNIRLGHAIVLLPFLINHPLRVAERIAVLDILSGGRVDFGGGRAISESELSAFGVDPEDTRPQWEEALRMLPKMWTQDEFSWDSPLMKIPTRNVTPKPMQRPHPPMWVSATQPSTIEFAGKNGLGVLGFGIGQGDSDNFVRQYREEIAHCTPIGEFVNNRFALWVHSLCLPTDEEALEVQGPNFAKYGEQVRALFAPWTTEGKAPRSYEWFMKFYQEQQEALQTVTMEDIIGRGGAALGSPDTCLQTLQHVADAGVDEVLLFMQGADTPHEKIMQSIELFATEVKPRLKEVAKEAS